MRTRSVFPILAASMGILLCVGAVPFILAHRARVHAARYLSVVTTLRIGTPYDSVVAQLRHARIPLAIPKDCQYNCILLFDFDDRWLYKLRLAAPLGLGGRLDFRDQQLVYKSTSMGHGLCCYVTVSESPSTKSTISLGNLDSYGHPTKPQVEVSPLDFSEYRNNAYSFNVACIGSMKACAVGEYLPVLERSRGQN